MIPMASHSSVFNLPMMGPSNFIPRVKEGSKKALNSNDR